MVASVDGLDVIDGKAAGHGKRGYILAAHSTLVIDGFRTSDETVEHVVTTELVRAGLVRARR